MIHRMPPAKAQRQDNEKFVVRPGDKPLSQTCLRSIAGIVNARLEQ